MEELHRRAQVFLSGPCVLGEPTRVIHAYVAGELRHDAESQDLLLHTAHTALDRASKLVGETSGPARDALHFYQMAAEILFEIRAELSNEFWTWNQVPFDMVCRVLDFVKDADGTYRFGHFPNAVRYLVSWHSAFGKHRHFYAVNGLELAERIAEQRSVTYERSSNRQILLNRIKAAVTASKGECQEAKTRWWHFWQHFAGKLYRGIQSAKRDSQMKE